MTSQNDSVTDWSTYPPDRVEGLKYFYKGPSSDEDGPCTEEELKMLCIKWDCKVDMKIDNFLFWLIKKTKERDFQGDHDLFVSKMPKITRALRKKGLEKYQKYQEQYGAMNREYLAHCADWRLNELRRLRWLEKLKELSSTWSWDDSEEEDEDSESNISESDIVLKENENSDAMNFSSNSSILTVIDTVTQTNRYNSHRETESVGGMSMDGNSVDDIGREEEIGDDEPSDEEAIGDVNTQSFVPRTTSTQKGPEQQK